MIIYGITQTFTPPLKLLLYLIVTLKFLLVIYPTLQTGLLIIHSITVNGNTITQPFGPYDAQEYATGSHGGSVYFDGTGDYLDVTSSAANLGQRLYCGSLAYWSADPRSNYL